ncbi:MAG: hypothetical protein VKL60_00365 [Sphaerospermopsis sp.]|nr:hypothetical protein [Sphaerospermopsis sp.]
MLIQELNNEQLQILDDWLDTQDPEGLWDIEFRPYPAMVEKQVTLFYILVDGPFIPYMAISTDFDDMMTGLEATNMRDRVDLKNMKSFTISYWE